MAVAVKNTMTSGLAGAFAAILDAAHVGLVRSGLNLQDLIVNVSPTPPIETGNMRGSVRVYDSAGVVPASRLSSSEQASPPALGPFQVVTAVTAPYSVYPHEKPGLGPISRQAGDAGQKFVSAKMPRAAQETGPIIAETIKDKLR